MVVKAKRVIKLLSDEERKTVKDLEKKIDQHLKKKMKVLKRNGHARIDIGSFDDLRLTDLVKRTLRERYRRAGWEVKIDYTQDDNETTSPTATRIFFVFRILPSYQ